MKNRWVFGILIFSLVASSLSCGISVDLGSPFASKTPIPPTHTATVPPPTATAIPPTSTATATALPSPTVEIAQEPLPAVEEQPTDEPVIEPTPTLPPQLLKISPENSVNLTLQRVQQMGQGSLQKIVFSPDGKTVLFAYSNSLIMLNTSDFSLIWKLDPGRYISDIVFTKDGSHLISCSPGGLVEMRDIATGSSLGSIIPQQEGVRSLSLSAHGEYFAVLDYSGTTTIWDVATGKKVQDNNGKSSPGGINNILLSPGGGTLLIDGIDSKVNKQVQQWDVTTGNYKIGLLGVIHEMVNWKFSPEAKRIFGINTRRLTAAPANTLTAWNALNGTIIKRYPQIGIITDYKISSDGATILAATTDGQLHLLDTEAGTIKGRFTGLNGAVAGMEFTPDNQGVIAVTTSGKLALLDVVKLSVVNQIDFVFPLSRTQISLSSGGAMGAFLSADRKILGIVDLVQIKNVNSFGPEDYPLSIPTISLSGKLAAAIDEKNRATIWEISSGKKIQSIEVKTRQPVTKMKFTPDDKMLTTLSSGQTIFWDVISGRKLKETTGQNDFAFSPVEKTIVTDSIDNKLYFYNVDTGKLFNTTVAEIVHSISFSPDGQYLAIGARKNQPVERGLVNMVYQINATSKERLPVEMLEIPGTLSSTAYSPDMRVLAATDSQGNVFLWDLQNGQKIGYFEGIVSYPSTVTFNDDGTILFVCGGDSTIYRITTTMSNNASQPQAESSAESSAVPELSKQPYTHSKGSVTVNLPLNWKLEEQSPLSFTSIAPDARGVIAFLAVNTLNPLTDEGFLNFIDGFENLFSLDFEGYKENNRGVEPAKGSGFVSKTIFLTGKEYIFESYYTREGSIIHIMNFMTNKPYVELYLPLYQGVFASLKVNKEVVSQQTPYSDLRKITDAGGKFTYSVPTGWGKDVKRFTQPVTYTSPEGTGEVHLEVIPLPTGDDTQKFIALQTILEQQDASAAIVNRLKGENQTWQIIYKMPGVDRNGIIMGMTLDGNLQILNIQYPAEFDRQYLPLAKKIIASMKKTE